MALQADAATVPPGYPRVLEGAAAVARGARSAAALAGLSVIALVDGMPGIVYAPRGKARIVLAFTYRGDRISAIDVIAYEARLDALELAISP